MPSSACCRALRDLHSFPTRRSSDLVEVVLTDDQLPRDAMRTLQEVYPYAVTLRHEPANRAVHDEQAYAARVEGKTDAQVVEEFLTYRSEEHTSELQSRPHIVCRLLLAAEPSEIYTLSLHDALPIWSRSC